MLPFIPGPRRTLTRRRIAFKIGLVVCLACVAVLLIQCSKDDSAEDSDITIGTASPAGAAKAAAPAVAPEADAETVKLVDQLGSTVAQERISACRKLAEKGEAAAAAIPGLTALFDDSFMGVRQAAAKAIAAMGELGEAALVEARETADEYMQGVIDAALAEPAALVSTDDADDEAAD